MKFQTFFDPFPQNFGLLFFYKDFTCELIISEMGSGSFDILIKVLSIHYASFLGLLFGVENFLDCLFAEWRYQDFV